MIRIHSTRVVRRPLGRVRAAPAAALLLAVSLAAGLIVILQIVVQGSSDADAVIASEPPVDTTRLPPELRAMRRQFQVVFHGRYRFRLGTAAFARRS